jgi:hypothetical protein
MVVKNIKYVENLYRAESGENFDDWPRTTILPNALLQDMLAKSHDMKLISRPFFLGENNVK